LRGGPGIGYTACVLQLINLSKQYGSKVLFEGASSRIASRSRIALVGPNGAGKSTMIRMLLGQEYCDSGEVTRASHLSIGHLAQELPKFEARTILEEVMRLDGRRDRLLNVRKDLEDDFAESHEAAADAEKLERYGRILEELESLDEWTLESRARQILSGMGFQEKDFSRGLSEFSGGWLMRVAMARVLLSAPDLLILDEPTNHLDLESLLWLENFLQRWRGAFLLVSHDRSFLNRMVNEVWELESRKLTVYRGDIDNYATQKAERMAVLTAQYEGQQARIAEIEDFVKRFGAKATKARQAQSRLKELDRMERIELPEERSSVRFRFPPAPHGGREVVTLQKAGLSFGDKQLYQDINWVLQRGSRVVIAGVNGAGKTSLLRLLSGAYQPTQGVVRHGHEIKVGYYAQIQAESLDLSRTVLQELEAVAPDMQMSRVRALAGAFLFTGDAVEKKCAVLSGGEKARVALAKLLLSPANFLVLDEPTNHLDMESKQVLLEALQDFDGTLVLVSHDREFVAPLVDTVLEILPEVGGSRIAPQLGSWDDYLERKQKELSEREAKLSTLPGTGPSRPSAQATGNANQPAVPKGPSNNQKKAWEKEREKAEADISRMESRQVVLSGLLSDPEVYADKSRALTLMHEQRELETSLNRLMDRWEELCGLLG
jgi:ATP-binding cassette subfamily F protein 3